MYEVIRWISLAVLWLCIAVNLWCIIRGARLNKKLKELCAVMERLIKNWEKDHIWMEEVLDGRND